MPGQDVRGIMEARQFRGSRAIRHVTAAANILPHEHVVLITLPGSSTYVITLPPIVESFGIYTFLVTTDGAGTATVEDGDEGIIDYASAALTQLGDYVVLYCDGFQWYPLVVLAT